MGYKHALSVDKINGEKHENCDFLSTVETCFINFTKSIFITMHI